MGDVAREGRTVLFVSHDMGAVARLCRRAVWLQEGRLVDDDLPPSVIARYLATVNYAGVGEVNLANRTGPFAGGKARALGIPMGNLWEAFSLTTQL